MITDAQNLWDHCETRLKDYLEVQGVKDPKKEKFTCLNPLHKDTHPSMGIISSKTSNIYAKCHSCGTSVGILGAHEFITGSPNTPDNFIKNLKEVATILKVPFSLKATSSEDQTNYPYYLFYRELVNHLSSLPESFTYDTGRGWSSQTCQELGIFTTIYSTEYSAVASKFISDVKKETSSKIAIEDLTSNMGLSPFHKNMLLEEGIKITIKDENNRPIGFILRHANWEKTSGVPKYVYTSGVKNPIFSKSENLYNYANAISYSNKHGYDTLYVVEGHADAITLYDKGIKNVVAIGGTSLSVKQLQLLRKSNVSNIIFALDTDDPGKKSTFKILSEHTKDFNNKKIWIIESFGNDSIKDPDDFFSKGATQKDWLGLAKTNVFNYLIANYSKHYPNSDHTDMVNFFIPIIAAFPTAILREEFSRRLSSEIGYSVSSIINDVQAIVDNIENNYKNSIRNLADDLSLQIKKNPDNAQLILHDYVDRVKSLELKSDHDYLSGDFFADSILGFKQKSEEFTDVFPGYSLPLMPEFQKCFDNDWSKGTLIAIGGEENTGKTSMSCFLTYNIAMPESENNCRALYMTIDDSVEELFRKFICIAAKEQTRGYKNYEDGFPLQINHVVRPKYWGKVLRDANPSLEEDMMHAYQVGYNRVLELARSEQLVVIGIPQVRTFKDFYRAVERSREKFHDDNLWAFLDNIHKLPLTNSDARLAFKAISNDLKNMTVELDMSAGGTLEYNSDSTKRGKGSRPTNASLAESRAFRYDANALIHMYNNLHVDRENSPFYHEASFPWSPNINKRWPIVEAIIGKNKISDNKDSHLFKFHTGSSYFEYAPFAETIREVMEREEIASGKSVDLGKPNFTKVNELKSSDWE